jgi:hypothetical protein
MSIPYPVYQSDPSEFPGGNRGREIKYMTVLLISTTFTSAQFNGLVVQRGEFTGISDSSSESVLPVMQ